MSRGRGFSPRGGYRGSSSRGSNSWGGGGRGGYSHGGGSGGRFSSSFSSSLDSRNSFDSRNKYSGSSDRFSRSHPDDYHKAYRPDSSYSGRDSGRRSPDRKRMRLEASSRHDSAYGGYGPGRHDSQSSYSDRRSYSGDRHSNSNPFSRREEFRRPGGPPPSRGSYRGRPGSRAPRGMKLRDRPLNRRRLVDTSYAVRKRIITARPSDYTRRLKITKMRSAIARKPTKRRLSDKEDSGDEKPKETRSTADTQDTEEESKTPEKVIVKKEKEASAEPEGVEEKTKKKTFIKLHCPHCGVKAITFRKYDIHLSSRTHLIAMRKIALKQKSILAQMRQAQRNTQNELEKSSEDLTSKTNFCPLCKLNYKQKKSVHQLSESHKNMKKFLMPFCKVCNITFKSPMIYESHCCSIEHIKRKQRMENCGSDVSAEEDSLENFTTIDSVGDGEGSDGGEKKEEVKEPVSVGIEQIRRIEAYYCDLCKMYLPRGEELEMPKILSKHCKLRVHMQRYVRYKEDKELEKRAEKLQRKEMAEKEVQEKKDKNDKDSTSDSLRSDGIKEEKDSEMSSKCADDDEARDDKLWADVDKDLGDILAEAESGNKSSDEDEDSHVNGERYDRFKLSEKNDEDVLKISEDDEKPKKDVKEADAEKK